MQSLKFVELDKQIREKNIVTEFIQGHYKRSGRDAGLIKNPIWKISENNIERLLMFCENDAICKLCTESYNLILNFEKKSNTKFTFYKTTNGYIQTNMLHDGKKIYFYIHQIIMNCYGNGYGTMNISVDHIDNDPLNNTLQNLRLATREQQEMNKTCSVIPLSVLNTMTKEERDDHDGRGKRKRQKTARDLPVGISVLPAFIHYRKRSDLKEGFSHGFDVIYNGVEKFGTTSNKIPILEKLQIAINTLRDMQNGVPEKKKKLPPSVSIIISRDKPQLSYDKRYILKIDLPDNYDIGVQLIILNKCIIETYGSTMALDGIEKFSHTEVNDINENLPINVSIVTFCDKPQLSYNKKCNLKMVLPENYDIDEQLVIFNTSIIEKYGLNMALKGIEIIPTIVDDSIKLPDNVYIQPIKGKENKLILYQKSENRKRLSVKYQLPKTYIITDELIKLRKIVVEKYGEKNSFKINSDVEIIEEQNHFVEIFQSNKSSEPIMDVLEGDSESIMDSLEGDSESITDSLESDSEPIIDFLGGDCKRIIDFLGGDCEPIIDSLDDELERKPVENKDLLDIIQNLQKTNKTLNITNTTLEKENKDLLIRLRGIQPRTTTNFNETLVTIGPRLQKINPETFQIIQVYETVTECMMSNGKIKRPSIMKAIVENTVYCGFRWLLVERDLDPTIVTNIEATKETRIQNLGYIAKLDSNKSEIINVYLDRKTAAQNNGYESSSALDNPVKNNSISKGHYYILYDNCDVGLRENFVEKNNGEEPMLFKNGVCQYDSNMNVTNTFICKYDCKRSLKICDKTLTKALENNVMYNNNYYKNIGSKLKCIE